MSDIKLRSTCLKKTSPSLTKRYSHDVRVNTLHTTIPPALFTHSSEPNPAYLPRGWVSRVHPEGQLYFQCDSGLKIVTEEHLYDFMITAEILHWAAEVTKMIDALALPQSVEYLELYLELDLEDSACLYYIVDHSARSVFWLEEVETSTLGLPPAASTSHLKLAIEELYWNHVEYLPANTQIAVHRTIEELISVFTHAQVDWMTSDYSTFPYTSEQSARFLKLLQPYRAVGARVDDYIISLVARLWGVVVNHRFSVHYGQKYSRLSRDQAILSYPDPARHWVTTILSRFMFGIPAAFVDKFERLWVDDIVYGEQWRAFMATCQEDRKLFVSWSFGVMVVNLFSLGFPGVSWSLVLSSVLSAYGSVIFGIVLYIRQQLLAKANAAEAAIYIQEVKHKVYGFQFISLLYSLPKALFVWSLALYAPQGPMIVYHTLGFYHMVAATFVLFTVLFTLYLVARPLRLRRGPSFEHSDKPEENSSIV